MLKSSVSVGLAMMVAGVPLVSHATGFFGPESVLQENDYGYSVKRTPEFFWELECKRIAREFTPLEKRKLGPPGSDPNAENRGEEARKAQRAAAWKLELAEAIKTGYLKSEEATAGTEFEDYDAGALAYDGEKGAAPALVAWEKLLKRPPAERKYRSTWAEYMLGKLCLDEKKFDEAVKHFQNTRQLAREGFADGLGLAAESYGWEARAELDAGHAANAARLYLTQLALGDASAVSSLKALIPDRATPFNADGQDKPDAVPLSVSAYGVTKPEDALRKAAADPLLRRLVTAHVLAAGIDTAYDDKTGTSSPKPDRQTRWLAAVEAAGAKQTTDAENLGWVAYSAGKYAEAARWLKLSKGTSSAALWLKAKLALRDGKLKESADLLSEAVRGLPASEDLENSLLSGGEFFPHQSIYSDLGTVHLGRAEFVQALDAFLTSDLWEDAAYVAERCLTTKELLDYAAAHPAKTSKEDAANEDGRGSRIGGLNQGYARLRLLAARRLVREDDYKTARGLFPAELQKVLDDYTDTLARAANEKTSKRDRARALFHAAWIARYDGMDLMGTETGPDDFAEGGEFSSGDLAMERLTGKPHPVEDRDKDSVDQPAKAVRTPLPVSEEEKKRLAATKLNPELRFHYRHVAAGLAWKAATLLPDGAEETADVLNTAGGWLKDKHERQTDRFFQAIERRCPKTEIGKEAVKAHWIVGSRGPWSDEEEALDKKAERQRE